MAVSEFGELKSAKNNFKIKQNNNILLLTMFFKQVSLRQKTKTQAALTSQVLMSELN